MLSLVPITLKEAHAFVEAHHRHHDPDVGARFAIGAALRSEIVGGHVVGACSFLYAACWRAWRAMGGRRLVTYMLPEEGGG